MSNTIRAILFSPQAAMAEDYPEKAGQKLTNGVANATTGFLESLRP
jgi:hypothetical protein